MMKANLSKAICTRRGPANEADGWSHLILDGKVVDSDRYAEKTVSKKGKTIDAYYSGKTHDFGGNIQALMRPDGFPIWISDVAPGSVHDLVVAREVVLGALYAAAVRGLPTFADSGYEGAGQGVHTPVKKPADGHQFHIDNRAYNMLLRSMRCLGERGFALLTQRWRVLQSSARRTSRAGGVASLSGKNRAVTPDGGSRTMEFRWAFFSE
jgi:hypothetical protein